MTTTLTTYQQTEAQFDCCCGCGKYKDTGGICECGVSHRELCEECIKHKTLVKFYINDTEYDIVNLDEWEILEADHEYNEWGETIYYCWNTERSMTFDYVKENTINDF